MCLYPQNKLSEVFVEFLTHRAYSVVVDDWDCVRLWAHMRVHVGNKTGETGGEGKGRNGGGGKKRERERKIKFYLFSLYSL